MRFANYITYRTALLNGKTTMRLTLITHNILQALQTICKKIVGVYRLAVIRNKKKKLLFTLLPSDPISCVICPSVNNNFSHSFLIANSFLILFLSLALTHVTFLSYCASTNPFIFRIDFIHFLYMLFLSPMIPPPKQLRAVYTHILLSFIRYVVSFALQLFILSFSCVPVLLNPHPLFFLS